MQTSRAGAGIFFAAGHMTFETNPVKLLVRWQGLGNPLNDLERELLLVNLFEENRNMRGDLYIKANKEIELYRLKLQKGTLPWQKSQAQ